MPSLFASESSTVQQMKTTPRVDACEEDHGLQTDPQRNFGRHLLIDFWGAHPLDDLVLMEKTLRDCVDCCGATLLHLHLHHFTPHGGITGVAVLAESHISVHTWPERGFAAFDIYMCGHANPEAGVAVLKRAFSPKAIEIIQNLRGAGDPDPYPAE